VTGISYDRSVVYYEKWGKLRLEIKVFSIKEPCCDSVSACEAFNQCLREPLSLIYFYGSNEPCSLKLAISFPIASILFAIKVSDGVFLA